MKTERDVDAFLKLLMQTKKVLKDFLELSKKKPSDAVNKFKLGFVNTILGQANSILGEGNRPFDSFTTFSQDDVPTNSDVVLILSQYVGCLKKFGRDNTIYYRADHYWIINGQQSEVKANFNMLRDT